MERKTHQIEADEHWSKWSQNASKGCSGLQQSLPNTAKTYCSPQSKTVHG